MTKKPKMPQAQDYKIIDEAKVFCNICKEDYLQDVIKEEGVDRPRELIIDKPGLESAWLYAYYEERGKYTIFACPKCWGEIIANNPSNQFIFHPWEGRPMSE